MKSQPNDENMKNKVIKLVSEETLEMNRSIDQFVQALSTSRTKMRAKFLKTRDLSITVVYIPEIIASLQTIKNCINEGAISTCYREMRTILESLSWTMFDDFLLFKKTEKSIFYGPPYRMTSKIWYNWARKEKAQLNNIDELKNNLENIVNGIYLLGKIGNHIWDKKTIRKELITNLSYPLILLSSGKAINDSEKSKMDVQKVPQFDVLELIPLFQEHLENRVIDIKGSSLSELEKKFICEFIGLTVEKMRGQIIPPFPSNRFVLEMVGYITQQDLNKHYSEYSYFVHSYNDTWQHLPFSSVLEFKILKYQLFLFIRLVSRVVDAYVKALPQTAKMKFPEKV